MAAALIWYKQRQRAARARREESGAGTTRPTVADGGGRGVLVFDIETTNLIEDEVPLEDREASVACAMWLPHGATAAQSRPPPHQKRFAPPHVDASRGPPLLVFDVPLRLKR